MIAKVDVEDASCELQKVDARPVHMHVEEYAAAESALAYLGHVEATQRLVAAAFELHEAIVHGADLVLGGIARLQLQPHALDTVQPRDDHWTCEACVLGEQLLGVSRKAELVVVDFLLSFVRAAQLLLGSDFGFRP